MPLMSGRARQLSHALPFVGSAAAIRAHMARARGMLVEVQMGRRTRKTTAVICLAFASAAACSGTVASQQESPPNPADTGMAGGGASGGSVAASGPGAQVGGGTGAAGNFGLPPGGPNCPQTLPRNGGGCLSPAEHPSYTCDYRLECLTISAHCVYGLWQLPPGPKGCDAGGDLGFGGEAGMGGEAGGGVTASDAGAAGERAIEPAPMR